MKDHTDYIIANETGKYRAQSGLNRKLLVSMVSEKLGFRPGKGYTMSEMRTLLQN